jgi:hypothetical protein
VRDSYCLSGRIQLDDAILKSKVMIGYDLYIWIGGSLTFKSVMTILLKYLVST